MCLNAVKSSISSYAVSQTPKTIRTRCFARMPNAFSGPASSSFRVEDEAGERPGRANEIELGYACWLEDRLCELVRHDLDHGDAVPLLLAAVFARGLRGETGESS
jgi:hypothetical protein